MIQLLNNGTAGLSTLLPAGKSPPSPAPPIVLPVETTPSPTQEIAPPLAVALSPSEGTNPSAFGFVTDLQIAKEAAESFTREGDMTFGNANSYTSIPGLLTFGGNHYRNTFTYGTQTVVEKKLTRVWEVPVGSKTAEPRELGTWAGTGWTGMPILVEWPATTRGLLGIKEEFKSKDGLVEVIYPALDGKIYFTELSTGTSTREPLDIGVIMKCTASLDPRGYPLLYVGQSIPKTEDGIYGASFRIIDLIENKVIWSFGGRDRFAYRTWQAYSGSALLHAGTDTLLVPGENGVFYTVKLNSSFDSTAGAVSVNPGGLEKYRYKGDGYGFNEEANKRWVGMEGSVSVYQHYAFFADNGGRLQCLDLNTLELQYVVDVTDDSDSSLVIEEEGDRFYLYTANTIDKQPGASTSKKGKSYLRKIDGRTGAIVWEKEYDGSYGVAAGHGGTLSTPHIGRGNISDLVIYNAALMTFTITEDGAEKTIRGGRIIAFNKQTGEELWRFEQQNNYWSSPVVIYDKNNDGYLIQGDRDGKLRLIDPRTGELIYELDLGSAIDSTPAVFGDYLVVGTRGIYGSGETQKIIGIKIS